MINFLPCLAFIIYLVIAYVKSFLDKCQNLQRYTVEVLAVRALWVKWGIDFCMPVLAPSFTSVSPSVVENVPLRFFFLCWNGAERDKKRPVAPLLLMGPYSSLRPDLILILTATPCSEVDGAAKLVDGPLHPRPANFFFRGPNSHNFSLCRPYGIYWKDLILLLCVKSNQRWCVRKQSNCIPIFMDNEIPISYIFHISQNVTLLLTF